MRFLLAIAAIVVQPVAAFSSYRFVTRQNRYERYAGLNAADLVVTRLSSTATIQQESICNKVEAIQEAKSIDSEVKETIPSDVIIRRARPDEIDHLSSMVAECFQKSADDNSQSEVSRLLLSTYYKWDSFITRWTAYAGLTQRLLMSSFREGLKESSKEGEKMASSDQPLFVAELAPSESHDDVDSICHGYAHNAANIVGVIELAYGDCPIPFDISSRNNSRKSPFVCNLAVIPEYRGLGIGKALLERIEQAALDGEGLPLQSVSSVSPDEIWLETDFDNTPALRMYQKAGYVCEGVDPEVRQNRRSYMRKRLSESSPDYSRDILRIVSEESKGGERIWFASYDLEGWGRCIGEMTFIENNFGVLAPAVAVLGSVVGFILF